MTDQTLTQPADNELIDQTLTQFSGLAEKTLQLQGWHHPNISAVALNIGPLELRWYSLAYLFGIILGWLYVSYLNKKHSNNYLAKEALEALPMWIILSVVLGGRIGYILFYNLGYYLDNLQDIYKVWKGGMSFHGGLLGVILGTVLFSRYYKLKFFKVTDLLAAATPIGLFLGRLANFINKELIGKETKWEWGVIYPEEEFTRHASQIYEALMEGALLFVILFVCVKFFRSLERTGATSGIFLIFYGIFRAVAEIFREPDNQIGYVFEHISMGQILCVPMILAGVAILMLSKRKGELMN